MKEEARVEARFCARNYAPLPVVVTRGQDVYLYDTEGHRYLDMMSAYSAVSHGHAHPRLVRALTRQAERLAMCSRAIHSDRLGPFLRRACEMSGFERGLPMNTGAEAVETALKAARKWAYEIKGVPSDRAEIISCEGNFHGRTLAAVSLSSTQQYRRNFGPLMPGMMLVPFGDAEAVARAITPRTAAFLVEPIQGEGGIIVPPDGYLADCADICRRNGVLLICDEIQSGLGRTGRFLACEHDKARPDGVILGKALGGGLLPVSLFLARAEVMDVFRPGDHGSTFGGNPLAAAVGLEALDVLIDEGLIDRARDHGAYFAAGLRSLSSRLVKEVRGRGLFLGLKLDEARIDARDFCIRLLEHDIITYYARDNVVRLTPPLTVQRQHIDTCIDALGAVLDHYGDDAMSRVRVSSG